MGIWLVCSSQKLSVCTAKHQKVVTIVGSAHVPGIRAQFPKFTVLGYSAECTIERMADSEKRASHREAQQASL
jgi:hypothetical protein